MRVVGFGGSSGSGKTTLIGGVVAALRAAGLTVSVIKHAHHGFEIDRPGKDSWRHRKSGAFEVLVASPHLVALQRETVEPREHALDELLAMLAPVDWVLVEGYRDEQIPRIEVWRAASGRPMRESGNAMLRAVAAPRGDTLPELAPGLERLDLDDPAAVASWLLASVPEPEARPARDSTAPESAR